MCKADQVLLLLKAIYWPLLACMCAKLLQSCPTLCDSVDCSQPGSSVHRILQAKNTGGGCHALLQGIFLTQEAKCVHTYACTIKYYEILKIAALEENN